MEYENGQTIPQGTLESIRSRSESVEGVNEIPSVYKSSAGDDAAGQEAGEIILEVPLTDSAKWRRAMEIDLDMPMTAYDTSIHPGSENASGEITSGIQFMGATSHKSAFNSPAPSKHLPEDASSRYMTGHSSSMFSEDIIGSFVAPPEVQEYPLTRSPPSFDVERLEIEADLVDALPAVENTFLEPREYDDQPVQDLILTVPNTDASAETASGIQFTKHKYSSRSPAHSPEHTSPIYLKRLSPHMFSEGPPIAQPQPRRYSSTFSSPIVVEHLEIEADLVNALPVVENTFLEPWEYGDQPVPELVLTVPSTPSPVQPHLSIDAWSSPRSTASTYPIRNIRQALWNPTASANYHNADIYGIFGNNPRDELTDDRPAASSHWDIPYATSSPTGSIRDPYSPSVTRSSSIYMLPSALAPQRLFGSPPMYIPSPYPPPQQLQPWVYGHLPSPSSTSPSSPSSPSPQQLPWGYGYLPSLSPIPPHRLPWSSGRLPSPPPQQIPPWSYGSSPLPFSYQSPLAYTRASDTAQMPRIPETPEDPSVWKSSPNYTIPIGKLSGHGTIQTPTSLPPVPEEASHDPQEGPLLHKPVKRRSTVPGGDETPRASTPQRRITNIASAPPRSHAIEEVDDHLQTLSSNGGYDPNLVKGPRDSIISEISPSASMKSSWELYNERALHEDKDFIRSVNESMDPLLVFAGLFSAVLAGFLQFTLPLLKESQQDVSTAALSNILAKINNSTYQASEKVGFEPSTYAIRVNCMFFASIASALVAGLGAILVKQWTRQYEIGLDGISSQQLRARIRYFRMNGVTRWHLMDIAAAIPITVHLSLFCFFIGMIDFLLPVSKPVALVVLTFLALAGSLYITTSTIPVAFPQAPFRSPLTLFVEHIMAGIKAIPSKVQRLKGGKDKERGLLLKHDWPSSSSFLQPDPKFDVDVLTSLIKAADHRTESWILDRCIQGFRDLELQPTVRTRLFQRQEILEAYRHLAASCVRRRMLDGADTLDPNQEARARALCEFAAWMTHDESNQIELSWLARYLPQNGDELPRLLLRHGLRVSRNEDTIIAAHLALSARNHIHTPSCWNCLKSESEVYHYLLNISEHRGSMDEARLRSTRVMAIRFINNQTYCLLHFAAVYPTEAYIRDICKLVGQLQLYNAATADAWDPIHLNRDHPLPPPRRATRDDKWVTRRNNWLESLRNALGVISPENPDSPKERPYSTLLRRNRQSTL